MQLSNTYQESEFRSQDSGAPHGASALEYLRRKRSPASLAVTEKKSGSQGQAVSEGERFSVQNKE